MFTVINNAVLICIIKNSKLYNTKYRPIVWQFWPSLKFRQLKDDYIVGFHFFRQLLEEWNTNLWIVCDSMICLLFVCQVSNLLPKEK